MYVDILAFVFLRRRPWINLSGTHWIDSSSPLSPPNPAPLHQHHLHQHHHNHHQNLKDGGRGTISLLEFSKSFRHESSKLANQCPVPGVVGLAVDNGWKPSERVNNRQAGRAAGQRERVLRAGSELPVATGGCRAWRMPRSGLHPEDFLRWACSPGRMVSR